MFARWIATVAALLLVCAQASAHVRSERAADLGTFAAGTEHALEIQRSAVNASPGELPTNPKTAPPARASLENSASGGNAPLTHCHARENWSPLKKCASGVHKYLYANGNPGSYLDPDGRQSVDLQVQSCDENGSCNTTPMAASALPFIDPSQFATQRQADAVIEARARMALFGGGRSDSPMVAQPLLASGAGQYQRPYVEHGSSRQLSAMQSSAALDEALGFDPNYVSYGQATEAAGEMAFHSIPPVAITSGLHTMATAEDGWQFTAGALEATLGALPMALAGRAEMAALRAERVAMQGRPAVVVEGTGNPVLRSVDSEAGIGQIEHPLTASRLGNRKLPDGGNPWITYQQHVTGRSYEELWRLGLQKVALDGRRSGFTIEAKWTGRDDAAFASSPYNPSHRYYNEAKNVEQARSLLELNKSTNGGGVRYAVSNAAARDHFAEVFESHFPEAVKQGDLQVFYVPGTGMRTTVVPAQ